MKNILVYNISCKTLIDAKLLRIRFNKVDRFIKIYDGTRYLILFGSEKYDYIYSRISYLISVKSGITHIISYFFEKTIVDWYDSSPLEKTMTFHNVIRLIKSDFKDSYYCNIFLELALYELPTKTFFCIKLNAILW